MSQKFYTVVFKDETSDARLSTNSVISGAQNTIASGAQKNKESLSPYQEVMKVGGNFLIGQATSSISQVAGVNVAPALNLAKGVFTGAGAGAIASAAISLAMTAYQAWQSYANEQRQNATSQNNRDNLLIMAGNLNLNGVSISRGTWGRDAYNYYEA